MKQKNTIQLHFSNNKTSIIPYLSNDTSLLSKTVWLNGLLTAQQNNSHFSVPALCSGVGHCKQCKGRLFSDDSNFILPPPTPLEEKTFTKEELTLGWRLLCRHSIQSLLPKDSTISFSIAIPYALTNDNQCIETEHSQQIPITVAIDIGTTSIAWEAFDKKNDLLAGSFTNPQMSIGSDSISRLAYATTPEHRQELQAIIVLAIEHLCNECLRNNLAPTQLCVTGHTSMLYILLNYPVARIAVAPYSLKDAPELATTGVTTSIATVPAWLPPASSPFIGSDITAGITYLHHTQKNKLHYPYILADLGTNGEFVLALSENEYITTSVPLGPALEGIGLSCGGIAEAGAVAAVQLTPAGIGLNCLDSALQLNPTNIQFHQPAKPTHFCATGYISLLHLLLRLAIITAEGHFQPPASPLAQKVMQAYSQKNTATQLYLHENLYISAVDIEEFLKVKAAFSQALQTLLATAQLTSTNLTHMYLAGSLGQHANKESLAALGFIPLGMVNKCTAIGNASLFGAKLFLQAPQAKNWAQEWCRKTHEVHLAHNSSFQANYINAMRFGT